MCLVYPQTGLPQEERREGADGRNRAQRILTG